jgi:hypothetical protein
MADVSELYPKAPGQQQGGFGQMGPLQLIETVRGLQQLPIQQEQLRALTSQADTAKIGTAQAATALEQAKLNQALQQQQAVRDFIGTLDPRMTKQQIDASLVEHARNSGVPTQFYTTFRNAIPDDPKARAAWVKQQQISAAGSAPTLGQVPGPPGPGGAPQTTNLGEANRAQTPGAPAAAPGTMATGLPPGQAEAAQRTGTGSGEALDEARKAGLAYRRQVFPLEKAIPALERLGTSGTGPGSETVNHLWSFAQSMGMPVTKKSGDAVKDFDTARKYLGDWVMQNGDNRSVQHLLSTISSNPSVSISNAAATDLAKAALILRRSQHALLQDFEATGLPEQQFTKWASQENAKRNLDVYGLDLMSPKQRNAAFAAAPNKKQFLADVQRAEQQGILNSGGLK